VIISKEFLAKPLQQMPHNFIFGSTIVQRFVGREKFVKVRLKNLSDYDKNVNRNKQIKDSGVTFKLHSVLYVFYVLSLFLMEKN